MKVIEIGPGEKSRRISGCIGMDPNEDVEYDGYTIDKGLPFEPESIDMFISRYSFRNVWVNDDDLKVALAQMEKTLKWGGIIIIKDYPEGWNDDTSELVDCSPTTIKESFARVVKGIPNLEMESFAFSLDNGDYQLWIVKEPS